MSINNIDLPLTHAHTSQLLIVNVQEKLFKAMPKTDRNMMVSNINRLTRSARYLGIPIILSESYGNGLGETIPEITQHLPPGTKAKDNLSFSCCTAPGFEEDLAAEEERKQIIIVGLEAHICVLQTASGLQQWGYQVFAIEDAICSRSTAHRDNATQRMRQGGVKVSNSESVAFEWLGEASHPHFSEVSQLFR